MHAWGSHLSQSLRVLTKATLSNKCVLQSVTAEFHEPVRPLLGLWAVALGCSLSCKDLLYALIAHDVQLLTKNAKLVCGFLLLHLIERIDLGQLAIQKLEEFILPLVDI